MIDPVMNGVEGLTNFKFAAEALTGKDEYSMKYLKFTRGGDKSKRAAKR